MAALDVTQLIDAAADYIGQQITLKAGVVATLESVRRSGAAGDTLVIVGTITKDGVTVTPAGGWPIVWSLPVGGVTKADAMEKLRSILADVVS